MIESKSITRRSLLTLAGTSVLAHGCGIGKKDTKPAGIGSMRAIVPKTTADKGFVLRTYNTLGRCINEDTNLTATTLDGARTAIKSDGTLVVRLSGQPHKFVLISPSNSPTALPSHPDPDFKVVSMVFLTDGRLLALGNLVKGGDRDTYTTASFLSGNQWSTIQFLELPNRTPRGVLGPDNKVYVITGEPVGVYTHQKTVSRVSVNGSTLTKEADILSLPDDSYANLAFTKNGLMVIANNNTNQVTLYDKNGVIVQGAAVALVNKILPSISVGQNFEVSGDEWVFVGTEEGIIKIQIENGAFKNVGTAVLTPFIKQINVLDVLAS